MSECGFISEAWTCVKAEGHVGGHVYELRAVRPDSRVIAAAEERGRRAGIEEAHAILADALKQWPASGLDYVLQKIRRLAPRDSGKEPAKMDAPDGPQCWCGMPSTRENGWCGTCNFAKDRK